jgi:hypothetical protein
MINEILMFSLFVLWMIIIYYLVKQISFQIQNEKDKKKKCCDIKSVKKLKSRLCSKCKKRRLDRKNKTNVCIVCRSKNYYSWD